MVERFLKLGWLAAEVGLLLIVLCVFLNILLGNEGGAYIAFVSDNAARFLQALPPGVTLVKSMFARRSSVSPIPATRKSSSPCSTSPQASGASPCWAVRRARQDSW